MRPCQQVGSADWLVHGETLVATVVSSDRLASRPTRGFVSFLIPNLSGSGRTTFRSPSITRRILSWLVGAAAAPGDLH